MPTRTSERRQFAWVAAALLAPLCAVGGAHAETPPVEYQTSATVLESTRAIVPEIPAHRPQLCWTLRESLPPQCSGPDVVGWDWSAVNGERSAAGTTWGDYTLVGTFDGTTFTLTRPARSSTPSDRAAQAGTQPDFRPRCGNLSGVPGRLTTARDLGRARKAAASSPFVGAVWVTPRSGPDVLNVRFARNAKRLERALRRLYRGPICVTEGGPTRARLRTISTDVVRRRTELFGPNALIASGAYETEGIVEVRVIWDRGGVQEALDQRYGAGVVRMVPMLRPVSSARRRPDSNRRVWFTSGP